MANDVSRMNVSELNKLSAKIEKRRQELAQQEALSQMKAVAKKHGVDFADIARLHSTKLPKASTKVERKSGPKSATKTATAKEIKAPIKAVRKTQAKPKAAKSETTARTPKLVSKAKYKNPDNPKQTWSGMGRKPGWLIAHLDAGKKLEGLAA